MMELWNILGLISLFGFVVLAIFSVVIPLTVQKKPDFYVIGAGIFLLIFIGSTVFFPGEKKIAKEVGVPQKIYSLGLESEKNGTFDRAKKYYEIVLGIDPENEKAAKRLELIGRREIVLTFLERGKKLMLRGKFVQALVKLKMAESIASGLDVLKDAPPLKDKIKQQIKRTQESMSEKKNGFSH